MTSTSVTINVIIVDDHELVREGFKVMFEESPNIKVIGEAADGRLALREANLLLPDIVIMDIMMPNLDGIEATRQLTKQNPTIKVIGLSMFNDEHMIIGMLEAGGQGYLLKNASKTEIIEAIESVYSGKAYYCRNTSPRLAQLIASSRFKMGEPGIISKFSDKEKEIIRLFCQQLTIKEVAARVFLSEHTIEKNKRDILEKAGVKNLAGLVVYAIREKIFCP